ncbi:hypothetical protein KIH41_10140 [Litoribacter ruber]|uniref:Uncharacterized protein n=1 Tax=Litoribacter ruber TaxID=702568 RepID=A0AAP2CI66_9BACT|nr:MULTISPECIES: hypothetical protein [Litoribacter]MBS9525151.1 hypothetical protein [Litoribacter alkaliphilus]MBT0811637.1 hypothetical protein [Litoribacter ruber]
MHNIKINYLIQTLLDQDIEVYPQFDFHVSPSILDDKGKALIKEVYNELGGNNGLIILPKVRADFKVGNTLFFYDNENHFNRYRLKTLKTELYDLFAFGWKDAYLRLCRTYEKDCLQSGMQDRIWNGPPVAKTHFGKSEDPGDLTGNGSSGWKLNAYNDAQIDLFSRLYGYRLVRIAKYENIMLGGGLKSVEQLILSPDPQVKLGLAKWLQRKAEL